MNEKLNIQDLIDLLAEKHGMSKKNADGFVKEFFLLIEESLEKDKYVKIKGLGTFKLIDVDSRESVNVNTGERFEIQGHTKVSFTPEPSLKDIINKPFAHFETVALNDDTVLEDTPLDSDNEDDEEIEQKTIETATEAFQAAEVTEEAPIVAEVKEVPLPESEEIEEEIQQVAEITPEVPKPQSHEPIVKEATESSTMKYFIGIVVFVVLLCGGAVVFMYYPDLLDGSASKPAEEQVVEEKVEKTADKIVLTDSLSSKDIAQPVQKDTVAEALAVTPQQKNVSKENIVATPKKEQKKSEAAPFKPDSVGYTIVGTEATYTIKEGETLTKVAFRFYGTKTLWPYIVKYNPGVIKNPDNVPFGTTIKIPKLVKKQ